MKDITTYCFAQAIADLNHPGSSVTRSSPFSSRTHTDMTNKQLKHHSGSPKSLIVCPIFLKELQCVLAEYDDLPVIHFMHYAIHIDPELMQSELIDGIDKAKQEKHIPHFLVGKNCNCTTEIADVVEHCGGKIVDGGNCIETLLGKEVAQKLQENRTTLMTPAWIKMINDSINDGRWTKEDFRINLGMFDRIVILDFGIEPIDDEMLIEFFDLTQVMVETMTADLDHFKKVIAKLLTTP